MTPKAGANSSFLLPTAHLCTVPVRAPCRGRCVRWTRWGATLPNPLVRSAQPDSRPAWAAYANNALETAGRPERIDHRSYKRQGIDKIPTVHMGVAATQMEKRGVPTRKGNLNRQIAADNKLLKEIKARITRLYNWTKEQAAKPEGKESIMAQLYEAQLLGQKPGSR